MEGTVIYNYSIENDTLNAKYSDKLAQEIHDSDITISLKGISSLEDSLDIEFFIEISASEKLILDDVVANHDGISLEPEKIIKTERILAEGGKRKTDRGFKFSIPAGTTVTYDYNVTNDLQVKGGVCYTDKAHINDQVSFEIVDVDYLYAGEWYDAEYAPGVPWSAAAPDGVPLHQYIGNFPVDPSGKTTFDNEAITNTPLNGLAMRVTYKSNGADDVNCNVGIIAYT
tara:strand:+ start:17054 stop:17737 length:684 start_codon:yes stop_codon:yes gene_type:complete